MFAARSGRFIGMLAESVNDFDPIGSLSVEILIDGATTIKTNYQLQSGCYEAMWNSTTVPAGTVHTILAAATDSVGTSQPTFSVVLVE